MTVNGAHGSVTGLGANDGTYVYTPAPDFDGTDTFTLQVSDGHGGTDTVAVNVTMVNLDNSNPVFSAGGDSGSGNEETLISGTVSATDPDTGDTLTYSIEAGDEANDGPAAVNPSTGEWTYTGDLNFVGSDSFTITASDGNGGSDTIVVNLTVDNLNDNPVFNAGGDSGSGDEETLMTDTVSATDVENDTLTYSIEAGQEAADGARRLVNPATGAWTYTGDLDFAGTDSFTITASDGNGGSDTIVVNLTVDNLNDAPTASRTSRSAAPR